jgi:glucose-1-phosphatase
VQNYGIFRIFANPYYWPIPMLVLSSGIPGILPVKNIIFDFGNVICDLDIKRTEDKFLDFGPPKPSAIVSPELSSLQFEKLVNNYESGLITSAQFRGAIRDHYVTHPSDRAIDETWNALLVGIPEKRIRLLEEIRKTYRIFLLSNSNEIHYTHYLNDFRQKYGYKDFAELFEKAYFSFLLKIKKPDPEIFRFVLEDSNLTPAETLFIDDTLMHVEAARKLGMNVYHLQGGEEITDLFTTR